MRKYSVVTFVNVAIWALIILALIGLLQEVRAGPLDLKPDAVFVQLGDGDRTRTATVGLDWRLPWKSEGANGDFSGYLEASIGRWWIDDGGMRRSPWVSQVGLTPVLRWRFGSGAQPWFAEVGIGLNVLSPLVHDEHRRFSTKFNFGDHLAVGHRLGKADEIALRLQHFSNGGIRQPNPGINFVQVRWTHGY